MRIFDISGSEHFCKNFGGINPGKGVSYFISKMSSNKISLKEGTPDFDELRDCLIRESERCAFFSATLYVNSLRNLRESTAAWKVVELYYAAFFCAKSLLALFGGWFEGKKGLIQVVLSNPGSLELSVSKNPKTPPLMPPKAGSHQAFWYVFYDSTRPLRPWISSQDLYAIEPISNDPGHLIGLRNKVNYLSQEQMELFNAFNGKTAAGLDPPGCFPPDVEFMLNLVQKMQKITHNFRDKFRVKGDDFTSFHDLKGAIDQKIITSRDVKFDHYFDSYINNRNLNLVLFCRRH